MRPLHRLAVAALGLCLLVPGVLHAAPKAKIKESKCIEDGKSKCNNSKMFSDRSCFSTLDRALMTVLNNNKKCSASWTSAKNNCVRAAMFCHRSQSAAVCGPQLKSCNTLATRRHNQCTKAVDKYKKSAQKAFRQCSNRAKRSYNQCVKAARASCRTKKVFKQPRKLSPIRR